MNDYIINELLKFQTQHPNIYIGGSVSLILQGIIPEREPKDIDIISKEPIHIYDIFNVNKPKLHISRVWTCNNLRYEIFINPTAEYIEYDTGNGLLKISPIDEIMKWKKKIILKHYKTNPKHKNDLNEWINKDYKN